MVLITFSNPVNVGATTDYQERSYDQSLIELTEDVKVYIDKTEKATLKSGTILFAEEVDSAYQVQWEDSYFIVENNKFDVIESKNEIIFKEYSQDLVNGYVQPVENVDFINEQSPYFSITLDKNQNYEVFEQTNDAYELVIGNRIVEVSKNLVSFTSFEEDQGEVVEQAKEVLQEEQENDDTDTLPEIILPEKEADTEKQADTEKETVNDINSHKKAFNNVEVNNDQKAVIKSTNINKNENYQSINYGNFFKVINDEAVVYDNRGKELKKIGTLIEGQVYPIISDYGNWHRIQFGSHYGYVHKLNTIPGSKSAIDNLNNSSYENSTERFKINQKSIVYDNTSGELIPFVEVEKDQEHEIVSDYGNWYRILVADRVGYIHKSNVTRLFTENTNYFEVTGENLPVYDNRTGELVEIGTLEKGQVYPRVSDYGNWHRIKFGDIYGYVYKADTVPSTLNAINNLNSSYKNSSEKFIAMDDAVIYDNTGKELVPFAKIGEGIKFPIVSDYGNWYRVLISNRVGYVHKKNVEGYFSSKSKYFEVTHDKLPVFDNRGKNLKKIGELTKGQVFERVSDYGNWHRIEFGNHYGYVYKSGTIPTFKNQIPNYNTNYKNSKLTFTAKNGAVIYDNTSGNLIPFAELEVGEIYPIASDYGNWYRVLIANKVGYINKNNVTVSFTNDMKYFKVTESDLPIFDNRSGSLKKVGTLKKGQTYQRVSDYGDWHRIQYGDIYGYVYKQGTEPSLSSAYKNKIKTVYSIGTLTAKKDVTVYDNTSSKLIPFATIDKGKSYPIVSDYGNWYEINLSGRYGYVRKGNVDASVMVATEIVNPKQEYTYDNLVSDINQFEKSYPGLISWESIGKSVDGRNLYAIKLGTGKKEIFMNGAHHAREWMTTNLLMEMIDEYSQAYVNNQSYGGYNVRKILNDVSIWFVPMVNPDGVTLVQKGAFSAKNPSKVLALNDGNPDFSAWKANIRGVDLNRQYPAGWSTIRNNKSYPGPDNHKGSHPLSEPETKALYNFTKAHNFKTAVAYHSSGEVLYWDYKISGTLKTLSRRIANKISNKTGYSLVFSGSNPSGGGYTDWFLTSEKKPGFTPEISPHVGPRPVPLSNFNSVWNKNNTIGLMLAQEAASR